MSERTPPFRLHSPATASPDVASPFRDPRFHNPPPPQAASNLRAAFPRLGAIWAFLFGLGYLLLMPPFQVPDEAAHFNRAAGIATGRCIGAEQTAMPFPELAFESAFPGFMERLPGGARWVATQDLARWLKMTTPASQRGSVPNPAANLYTCLPYLPSAAAIDAARYLTWPPLAVLYAARLANLIAFVFLLFLALKCMPGFRLPLLGLAIMPMTLHQAASVSADALTLSITFCLLAYILKLSFGPAHGLLRSKELAILCTLVVCSSLMKFNVWLVLLTLLIPAERFAAERFSTYWHKGRLLAALLFLACSSALVWQWVNHGSMQQYIAYKRQSGIDIAANIAFSRAHPPLILESIVHSLLVNADRLTTGFVGYLGYLTVPLPPWLVYLFVGCLLGLALTQTEAISLRPWHRLLLTFVVAASLISVFALIFNFETEAAYIRAPAPSVRPIGAVQGRYFIPFALLFLLLLSNRRLKLPVGAGLALLLLVSASSHATAYYLIWQDYYGGAGMKTLQVHGVVWPDGSIFLSVNGKLHRIPDSQTLKFLNLHEPLTPGNRAQQAAAVANDLPALPGRVIKQRSRADIFWIDNGARHGIPNPATQVALGLTDVHLVSGEVMAELPQGLPLPVIPAEAKPTQ